MTFVEQIINQYETQEPYINGSWKYPEGEYQTVKKEVDRGYCKNCLNKMTELNHEYQDFYNDIGNFYRCFYSCG